MTQLVNGRARPTPLTAGPGYLVRNAHKALSRRLALELARHGIAFKHYYYLRTLFEEDGIMQAELSERTGMERATVTVVLDTMERQGLEAYPQPRGPAEDPRVPHAEGTAAAPAAARRGRERDASRARGDLAARVRASP